MSATPNFQIDTFDGFAIVRMPTDLFADAQFSQFSKILNQLCAEKYSSIFLDLGAMLTVTGPQVQRLATAVAAQNSKGASEIVWISQPAVARELQASPLGKINQFYEHRDDEVRRMVIQKVLHENSSQLRARLESTLDNAVQVALQRWIGQKPLSVAETQLNLNPSTDVISVVDMVVDGCTFRIFLSSPQSTLRGMVTHIFDAEVSEGDPAIQDSACELLNYLTAFFRQRLTKDDSVVEIEPPQLLAPDEIMAILDLDVPARRIETSYGTFDVWLEAAA